MPLSSHEISSCEVQLQDCRDGTIAQPTESMQYYLTMPTNGINGSGSATSGLPMEQDGQPTVLLLEGWSMGPLIHLRKSLQDSKQKYKILEPALPMPPFLGTWWWDRNFIAMAIGLLGICWSGIYSMTRVSTYYGGTAGILCAFCILASVVGWIRLMAVVAVRCSIRKGVAICLKNMHEYNIVAIVAFSWGGAVLAELLVQGQVGYHATQPAALLIAPATASVAKVTMREDAALRIDPVQDNMVHVVHATHDRQVCPHPERWQNVDGVEYTMLSDIHIFQEPASQHVLTEILVRLLQQKANLSATSPVNHNDALLNSGETTARRAWARTSSLNNFNDVALMSGETGDAS
jgi:hypothetical protein